MNRTVAGRDREISRLEQLAKTIDGLADSIVLNASLENLTAAELSRLQTAKYDLWNAANTFRSIKGVKS